MLWPKIPIIRFHDYQFLLIIKTLNYYGLYFFRWNASTSFSFMSKFTLMVIFPGTTRTILNAKSISTIVFNNHYVKSPTQFYYF